MNLQQSTLPLIRDGISKLSNHDLKLAAMIDHTILVPEASYEKVREVCIEAVKYQFKTVCVNSSHVAYVARLLEGSGVLPISVIGFPLGMMTTDSKAFETKEAIAEGAMEIDMVINISAMKSKNYALVEKDIAEVVKAAGAIPVKVILETSKLNDEEKRLACEFSKNAGAAFVKTSTGFGGGGATKEDIALMRKTVGAGLGVKASGGVRTREDALAMIEAGANRIGASASVAIVTGGTSNAAY